MLSNSDVHQLFLDLYEGLHRYAFTIVKDQHVAKDIVHNVFLHLLEKDNLIIKSAAKAYLYRAVYNESINSLKKEELNNKHHRLILHGSETTQMPDYYTQENLSEIKKRIDNVLEQLPPQCREVFIRSRGGQMKYSEIATAMGISVKTVEAHMSKALKLIRSIVRVNLLLICLLYCEPLFSNNAWL